MSRLKYRSLMLLFTVIWVNSISAIPTPLVNDTTNQTNESSRPKFVEIKLPVKIASVDHIVSWVKNAMRSMASKIDITVPGAKSEVNDTRKPGKAIESSEKKPIILTKIEANQSASPRNSVVGFEKEAVNPWPAIGNEIFSPLLNAEAFLPLFFGNNYADKFRADDYSKYSYNTLVTGDKSEAVAKHPIQSLMTSQNGGNASDAVESATESGRIVDNGNASPSPVPFSIPFEAFITITREPHDPEPKIHVNTTSIGHPPNISSLIVPSSPPVVQQIRSDCNHSRPYFEPRPNNPDNFDNQRPGNFAPRPNNPDNFDNQRPGNFESRPNNDDFDNHRPNFERKPYRSDQDFVRNMGFNDDRRRPSGDDKRNDSRGKSSKSKDSSRKRQLATLGDILKSLGLIRKSTKSTRLQEAATTTTAVKKPSQRARGDPPRATFQFEDVSNGEKWFVMSFE